MPTGLTVLDKLKLAQSLRVPHLLYDSCLPAEMPAQVQGALMAVTKCVPVTMFWRTQPGYGERDAILKLVDSRVRTLKSAGAEPKDCTIAIQWSPHCIPLPADLAGKFPTGDEGRWVKPLLTMRQVVDRYGFGKVAFIADVERYKDFDGSGPQPQWMLEAGDLAVASAFPGSSHHRWGCLGFTDPEQDGTSRPSPYFPIEYLGPRASAAQWFGDTSNGDEGPAEINCYYGGETDRIDAAVKSTRTKIKPSTELWLTLTCSLRGDKTGLHWGAVDWPLRDQFMQGAYFGAGANISGVNGLIEWKWSKDALPVRWADYLAVRLLGMCQRWTPAVEQPATAWM